MLAQVAHFTNVLLVVHGVDYAACAQKQTGFEKCVRSNVKHGCAVRPHAQCHKHQPEL